MHLFSNTILQSLCCRAKTLSRNSSSLSCIHRHRWWFMTAHLVNMGPAFMSAQKGDGNIRKTALSHSKLCHSKTYQTGRLRLTFGDGTRRFHWSESMLSACSRAWTTLRPAALCGVSSSRPTFWNSASAATSASRLTSARVIDVF